MADETRRKQVRDCLRQRESAVRAPGPGGVRQRLGEAFLRDLLGNFESRGYLAIEKLLAERPEDCLRLVADVLRIELRGVDVQPIVPRIRRILVRPGD